MFNHGLMNPDTLLSVSATVNVQASDITLYLPFTANITDQGFYAMTPAPLPTTGSPPVSTGIAPTIEGGWARFGNTERTANGGSGSPNSNATRVLRFTHPELDFISNSNTDFTIEFNFRIQGDSASGTYAARLKAFPFVLYGVNVNTIVTSNGSTTYNPGAAAIETGFTIGSHVSPGGFGYGAGISTGFPDGETGVAVACSTNETNPNGYVNRGFPAIPTGNSSTWGPYYFAIVRKNGVVTIFLNGKKIHSPFGADENGDGAQDMSSTWTWDTFRATSNLTVPQGDLWIGASPAYYRYGTDDDFFLQHFRVTKNVARYENDFTPEPIYTV